MREGQLGMMHLLELQGSHRSQWHYVDTNDCNWCMVFVSHHVIVLNLCIHDTCHHQYRSDTGAKIPGHDKQSTQLKTALVSLFTTKI